ncbi:MAG: methyltransferase domain-containing protein [Deltaproteobacteria bacterium]|nr:methyltransferase domain-containing protein [Deltaproteobacteria bacterium]
MFSLESFHKEYEADTTDLSIRERRFSLFVPRSIDRFVDTEDVFHDFPLWSKIWEASIVLSEYLAGIPVEPEKRFLEIGGGMGLVGIIASAFGHRVTMTEYNPDALNYARANAETNAPSAGSNLEIIELDWNKPRLEGLFDYIVGSEVVYKEKDFKPILRLFKRYLKPEGEIILAEGVRKTSMEFFRQMGELFEIKAQKKVLRSEEEETRVILCRMQFKTTFAPASP